MTSGKKKLWLVVIGLLGNQITWPDFFSHYTESYGKQSRAESDQDWICVEWSKIDRIREIREFRIF